MPVCRKCNLSFPNRVCVAGIVRLVHKRKYCLICSPFGAKNTKQLHLPVKQRKRLDYCHERQVARRTSLKAKLVKIKGGCCAICGYSRTCKALHFHHINEAQKEFALSSANLASIAWNRVLIESAKTVCLCSNCHIEVHAGMHKQLEIEWRNTTHKLSMV